MQAALNGLDVGQLKHLIVAPALAALGLGGDNAVNLVTGTALAESRAAYVRQLGGGPALGLWQMEPATHDDCWVNFLCFSEAERFARPLQGMLAPDLPRCAQLVSNLRYACAMARIRYYRVSAPLPEAKDAAALSGFHKQYYNTFGGSADAAHNIPCFVQAISG